MKPKKSDTVRKYLNKIYRNVKVIKLRICLKMTKNKQKYSHTIFAWILKSGTLGIFVICGLTPSYNALDFIIKTTPISRERGGMAVFMTHCFSLFMSSKLKVLPKFLSEICVKLFCLFPAIFEHF